VHVNLRLDAQGAMTLFTRPVEPFVVPMDDLEARSYTRLRVASSGEVEAGTTQHA